MATCDGGFDGDKLMTMYDTPVVVKLGPWSRLGSRGSDAPYSPPHTPQDAVTALLARTTAQLQAVERELAEERVKLEYTEDEILEMERKEELAEAVSER